MPEKVLHQIQYLCRDIAKVEWSGILFYKVEGSIKDPANMKLILEDILPMHKGTQTYTEYTFDERVVEHMMDNEHLEDCKIGHIHSHNTMGVFFSGTDWSELEDNAPHHNFYLSLIVNNFMDFCAKVCFIAEPKSLIAKDEAGTEYNFGIASSTDKKLVVYDCVISSPTTEINVSEDFKQKVEGIIKDAANRVTPVTPVANYSGTIYGGMYSGGSVYKTNPAKSAWGEDDGYDWEMGRWVEPYKPVQQQIEEYVVEDEDDVLDGKIEDFTVYALNIDNTSRVFHNITDIVKYHKSKYLSGRVLAKRVLQTYYESYKQFWELEPNMSSPAMYERVAAKVVENLEDERDSSTLPYMDEMLDPTIDGLTNMLKHFTNQNN